MGKGTESEQPARTRSKEKVVGPKPTPCREDAPPIHPENRKKRPAFHGDLQQGHP
jgi:hypothetical protein